MFGCNNKLQLENSLNRLSESEKIYFRRRWFLWQCSRVDEYLFYIENPNSKDQNWDIEFNNDSNLRFDVKGTVVPKKFRYEFLVSDEKEIINFYYSQQSKGVRYNIQNRLFIVHHTYYKSERSMYLRCHWKLKIKAFEVFRKSISKKTNFVQYKTAAAKCIFILESKANEFSFYVN